MEGCGWFGEVLVVRFFVFVCFFGKIGFYFFLINFRMVYFMWWSVFLVWKVMLLSDCWMFFFVLVKIFFSVRFRLLLIFGYVGFVMISSLVCEFVVRSVLIYFVGMVFLKVLFWSVDLWLILDVILFVRWCCFIFFDVV